MADLTPTAAMARNARRGLELHEQGYSGDGLKAETVRRANIIADRQELTEDHVREMRAWFARHESDKRPGWDDPATPGYTAWLLWSGDEGQQWSERKVDELDREEDRSNTMDIERRCLAFEDCPEAELTIETRANGTEVLTGYAAVYNRFSLPLREGGSQFREIILPGAFDKILSRQRGRQDVVALLNHDPNFILGRTSSGTLELSSDEKGLRYTVTPPDTQVGRDTLALVRRRDLAGSSFAFGLSGPDAERWTSDDKGAIREIREVSLLADVSVVLTPAYPASSVAVAMRSYEAWMASQSVAAAEPAGQAVQSRSALRGVAAAWSAILRLKHV